MVLKLDIYQIDVETAFLEGILSPEEYMYMECPEGMTIPKNTCLEIQKGMYGLVQSSRIFWQRMTKFLTKPEIGFKKSLSDQCVFYKEEGEDITLLLMYVDDSICMGKRQRINEVITLLKSEFKLKVEGGLNDFLGCSIIRNPNEMECWILQPHLIQKLKNNFEDKLQNIKVPKVAGTPRQVINKCKDEEEAISEKGQTEYRSGVGSLLFF